MSKNRKISTLEFDYLKQMQTYLPKTDKEGYKTLKYTMLDQIEGVFGDKWFNLRDKTRQAIDYICFLALDRGFVFASPDHIASEHEIARSTVYEALKVLRDEEILVKANRCSKKQNGLGCAVHIFTNHPYFDHINSFLNLGWKASEKADRKAEEAEIPHGTREVSDLDDPTFSLPSLYPVQNSVIQSNVPATDPAESSFVKYVPKEINELYAELFQDRLRSIWQKVTQAWKAIKQNILLRDDLITHGANIVKRILQLWKDRMRDNKDMSEDEMCAFAYKSARETFFNALGQLHMEDYDYEAGSISKARQKATYIPSDYDLKRSAKPVVPEVIIDDADDLLRPETRMSQRQDAIADIPFLERIVMSFKNVYILEDVIELVVDAIGDKYSLLDRHDLSEIRDKYERYTTAYHMLDDYRIRQREYVMGLVMA